MLKALVIFIVFLMIVTDTVLFVHSKQETDEREIAGAHNASSNWLLDGKKTVRVQNDLKQGMIVYLHCQSKDDDLHQHVLAPGQYQQWSFRDNFADTTLYWCNMFAYDLKASFEIYKSKIDENKCSKQCYRSVRADGLYFYNQFQNIWEKIVSWSIPI